DNFLPAKFDPPSFALRLAHKDVTLACALGRENKVPMRLAQLTLDEMTEALNRGWGDRDSRVAMLLQEERAGVEIKVDPKLLQEVLERGGKCPATSRAIARSGTSAARRTPRTGAGRGRVRSRCGGSGIFRSASYARCRRWPARTSSSSAAGR